MRFTKRFLAFPLIVAACLLAADAPGQGSIDHCRARGVSFSPVAGNPRAMLMETPTTSRLVYYPPRPRGRDFQRATVTLVIGALDTTWDADRNPDTVRDTVRVSPGTNVRWQWVRGFHTITNGQGGGDPAAGTLFDYLLDQAHPVFDTTLNTPGRLEYFCFAHEGIMHGVIDVVTGAGVPGPGVAGKTAFARPPAPNPTTGAVSFSIRVSERSRVELAVHDALGRHVAWVHRGVLEAGEHPFSWNGRHSKGAAATGVYVVVLRANGVEESRRFSLVR